MKHLVTIFLLAIVPAGVWAEFMTPDGKTIADTAYRKSVNNFGAQLVITNKEDMLLESWNAPLEGIYLPTADQIQKGETITALIAFKGCAQNKNGDCELSYKIKILRPDGALFADLPSDRPNPKEDYSGLNVGYIRLIVRPYNQTGTYTFVADVQDHVSGTNFSLTNSVEIK